jgi:hypothetical protein
MVIIMLKLPEEIKILDVSNTNIEDNNIKKHKY